MTERLNIDMEISNTFRAIETLSDVVISDETVSQLEQLGPEVRRAVEIAIERARLNGRLDVLNVMHMGREVLPPTPVAHSLAHVKLEGQWWEQFKSRVEAKQVDPEWTGGT